MSDRLNMTGLWHGTYVYPGFVGPTTPFVANLSDEHDRLSGTTMEPNLHGFPGEAEELEANIAGMRQDRSVDFTKTYDGEVSNEAIDYVGRLSDDGSTVTGVWSNGDMDGTFEMHRDLTLEELAQAEERAEMPLVVTPSGSAG